MNWLYEEGRIYSKNEQKELIAEVTFASIGANEVDINHTYVNPSLRGQGIAGDMLKVAAQHFREKGLKARATCPYAKNWLIKNKELYSDIISDSI
ncbi:MAG: N-acetyltransferase [Anaerolineaceae bacterium]|nr:MAG: N-acetyltransferase [Anaerolineaceae bacterium]